MGQGDGAYSCEFNEVHGRGRALGHDVVKSGRSQGWGRRRELEGGGGGALRNAPVSLVVVVVVAAALQVLTLNVPSAVVCAGELHPVLVHAPADAPLASTGRLALGDGECDVSA